MKQVPGQIDIFEAIDEEENGPPPCRCLGVKGWALETNPKSDYFDEWVHADKECRRSNFPGRKHHARS